MKVAFRLLPRASTNQGFGGVAELLRVNAAAGHVLLRPRQPLCYDVRVPVELTVVAVGGLLMGDDGVAVRVIQQLARRAPARPAEETIEYLDGSVGGLRLLNWIEQARRLLFVDAADFGGRPAQCRLLTLEQLLQPPAETRGQAATRHDFSLHQTDLAGVLRLASRFYRVPPTWLLAIQVQSVQPRDTLSEPLAAALPRLVEVVRRLSGRLARKNAFGEPPR